MLRHCVAKKLILGLDVGKTIIDVETNRHAGMSSVKDNSSSILTYIFGVPHPLVLANFIDDFQ